MENLNATKIEVEAIEQIAREELRKYKAEWRDKNRDKIKEYNKRYWAKRAEARKQAEAEKESANNND